MEIPYDPQTPYNKELTIAIPLVRLASKLSLLASPTHALINSVSKDDLTPITAVDIALQAFLTCNLLEAFPNDLFIGEESSEQVREDRTLRRQVWAFVRKMKAYCASIDEVKVSFPRDSEEMCNLLDLGGHGTGFGPSEKRERVWVMDPIDGTKAFIRGQQYAINLCLLDAEARQVLAVVGCPKLDPQVIGTGELVYNTQTGPGCLFFALRGHSAYAQEFTSCDVHNSAMLPARKLPNLSRVDLSNNSALRWMDSISIPCTGALQGLQRRAAGILSNKPQEDGPTYLHCDIHATILKWVFMATGNAQAWSRISGERAGVPGKHGHGMIWDYAGAMLLFEEVGGKVTDLEGRDINLSTGRKIDMSHGFVSAVAEVQGELLAATRKAVSDMGREDLLD